MNGRVSVGVIVRVIATAAVIALLALAAACSGTSANNANSANVAGTSTSTGPGTTAPVAKPVATSSPGCTSGATGPTPVKSQQVDTKMRSSGIERSYFLWLPATYGTTSTPAPLVVDMHGYEEGAAIHTQNTMLSTTADAKGFVLVTPAGTGKMPFWNAVPVPDAPNDLQFISDLIDEVGAHECIDPSRVYLTGYSNGAFMSSLYACRLADKVAAIAPVAGLRFPDGCDPSRPVPIIAFHGTADPLVNYGGGMSDSASTLPVDDDSRSTIRAITFLPMPDTLAKWAAVEGCNPKATETAVSASVTLIKYDGCRKGSVVELYRIDGGGHTWPGSAFSAQMSTILGPTTTEIDANALMWDFFSNYHLG